MTSQVCEPRAEQVQASSPTVPVTAPEGQQIVGWCVKAGSANQGYGPEEVTLDSPATAATITHSSGKDVSHYVLRLQPLPSTTVPGTTVPDATTTVVITTSVPAPSTTLSSPDETTTTVTFAEPPVASTTAETAPPPRPVPGTLPATGLTPLEGALGLVGVWAVVMGSVCVWLSRKAWKS